MSIGNSNNDRPDMVPCYPENPQNDAQDVLSSGPSKRLTVKANLKSYIGTKVVLARPMSEDEFLETVKGKTKEEIRMRETQGDGYEVTYEDGYVSWSPKEVFERCYREISGKEEQLIQTASKSWQQ